MSDGQVLTRKLTSLREHLTRMRRRRAGDRAAFLADVDRQDAVGMSLLVAVQDALDITLHIASDEGWGVPASYAEAFQMLATRGVIEPELAATLAGMAALRNRVAHGYGTVDLDRIWSELPAGLDALDRFAAIVAGRMGPGLDEPGG